VIENALVRHAPGDEQPTHPAAVKQCADPLEVPERFGPVGRLAVNNPARFIGIDDLVPVVGKYGERGRLSRPGHAGHEHDGPM
jgi:hypothetical protein